jgi:hypothetical protein
MESASTIYFLVMGLFDFFGLNCVNGFLIDC